MKEPVPYVIRSVAERDDRGIEDAQYTVVTPATVDLSYYWNTVRKHIWLALAIPASLAVLVVLRDVLVTPRYTAKSTILIKSSAPQVFEGTSIDGSTDSNRSQGPQITYNTQYQLLKSRTLAAKVIVAEDLAHDPHFSGPAAASGAAAAKRPSPLLQWLHGIFSTPGGHDAMPDPDPKSGSAYKNDSAVGIADPTLINAYLGDLRVRPVEDTELVTIGLTTTNPNLSAELANAHVHEFIKQGVELNSQNSEEAERFLKSKLGDIKRQVEESELALNKYRRDKGIIPGLISVTGKADVVLERLNKLSDDLEAAHLKSLTVGSQVEMVNEGHVDALPAVIESGIIQKLKSKLDEYQAQYAGMQGEYTAHYAPMAQLQAEMRGTQDALRHEEQSVAASLKQQYLSDLGREKNLEGELKRQKDFALGLNDAGVRYAILEREADTNRQLYNAILKRMKDVEVTADLHTSNVSIVDRAAPPLSPSSPRRVRDLLAALAFGLMGGIGSAFFLEYLDHTLKSTDEVRSYLGIPALSVIPDFTRIGSGAYGPRELPPERSLLSPAASTYGKEIILSVGTYSAAGEAYRTLRTAIQLSRAGAPPKSVLITSSVAHEGKTVTAVNTAIMLAITGKRVLLIDADLRRPRCHHLFGVENYLGLTEVLTGVGVLDGLIRTTEIEHLSFLSSGELPPNPGELLGSEKMREVLAELEGLYDYIIIDTPPVVPASDAVLLSTLVEGVVLVIGNAVPKQLVKEAISRLEYARAHILGTVLNQVNIKGSGYQYYYSNYSKAQNGIEDQS